MRPSAPALTCSSIAHDILDPLGSIDDAHSAADESIVASGCSPNVPRLSLSGQGSPIICLRLSYSNDECEDDDDDEIFSDRSGFWLGEKTDDENESECIVSLASALSTRSATLIAAVSTMSIPTHQPTAACRRALSTLVVDLGPFDTAS